MISAFGVVHKSFSRMRPKYVKVVERQAGRMKDHSMADRVRYNYAGMRLGSGDFSRMNLDGQEKVLGRKIKEYSNAQVTAAGSMSSRKRKALP